jgi:hypothetical protein
MRAPSSPAAARRLANWACLGLGVLSLLRWVLLAAPGQAQPALSCAQPGGELCRLFETPAFGAAYRDSYANTADPADAVDDLRFNMRRLLTGAGQASPAAIGRQVDAALDEALARAQAVVCVATSPSLSLVASSIAAGLAAAVQARSAVASAEMLGAMTGTLLGATRLRGAACLCAAHDLDGIRGACAAQ